MNNDSGHGKVNFRMSFNGYFKNSLAFEVTSRDFTVQINLLIGKAGSMEGKKYDNTIFKTSSALNFMNCTFTNVTFINHGKLEAADKTFKITGGKENTRSLSEMCRMV